MIRTAFFKEMEKTVKKVFSTGADTFLYELGYDHGLPTWENLFRTFKVGDSKDLDYALQIYNAVGWCRPRVLSYDKSRGTARIRLDDNFECEAQRWGKPASQFVRGHFAGAISALDGRKHMCLETRCVAKGDEFCEFELTPV
jgi:predicted hydrocarbon binding protein